MARKLSVDLELNAKGYTQGINEAKNATAQYTNATVDLKKETEDYLSQFGSLRKQLRGAKQEAFNLAAQFSQLSAVEKDSELGQQLAGELQFAIEKAAELEDVMSDTQDAIRNAASDTAGLDAFKESLEVGKDLATAYIGVLGKLTGSEEALKNALSSLAIVQGSFNAVIKTTSMLQKNSATMIALQRAGVLSLAQAEKVSAAAANASTIAYKGLGKAMKAIPFIAIAAAVLAIGKAIVDYATGANKATKEAEKLNKELTGTKKIINDLSTAYNSNYASSLGKTLSLYKQLQTSYSKLSTQQEKSKWIKENTEKFKELGVSITNVNDADKILIKQSKDVIQAFKLRAEAAAEATRLQDLYVKRIEAETKARANAGKNNFKAGDKVQTGDVERYGLQEGIDYTQYKDKVGMFYTDAGAMKAMEASAARNIQKYTQDIGAEINASAERLAATTEKLNNVLTGTENTNTGGGSSGTKTDIDILPKANKVNKQIDDWFKAYDKKIAAKTKEASEMNYNVVGPSINILTSPQQIQGTENAIQQALQVDDIEFDFSALPEAMQEAADEAVQSLDRLAEAMAIAGQQRAKFLAAGDTKGVEEMDKQLATLTEDYNKQSEEVGKYVKRSEEVKNLSESFQSVGDSVGALGGLFSALGDATDDAGMKTMGIIAETLATMALSFAKALKSCTTWYEWVAFGITGMTQLVSMVSQIKQLTAGGYAEGGIVPGNSFAGDKVMAMVNSGEMILNTHQQKNLFDMLNGITGTGISSSKIELTGKIRGKDLLLVQKNYNTIGSKSGQSIKIN